MKLFTYSNEVIEVELPDIDSSTFTGLEFALFHQKYTQNSNSKYMVVKDLSNGITLNDQVATITLSDTDVTEDGCWFVEMRAIDPSGEYNLDIRPSKVKFIKSKLGRAG